MQDAIWALTLRVHLVRANEDGRRWISVQWAEDQSTNAKYNLAAGIAVVKDNRGRDSRTLNLVYIPIYIPFCVLSDELKQTMN